MNKLTSEFLKSKKYSMSQKKLIFIGSVVDTILDYKTFSNNQELKEYVLIFENSFSIEDPFKEYLYKSRTLLLARICKEINNQTDNSLIKKCIELHLNYLIADNYSNDKNNKKLSDEKSLLEDMLDSGKSRDDI